jgi:hypothetical protein
LSGVHSIQITVSIADSVAVFKPNQQSSMLEVAEY